MDAHLAISGKRISYVALLLPYTPLLLLLFQPFFSDESPPEVDQNDDASEPEDAQAGAQDDKMFEKRITLVLGQDAVVQFFVV